MNGCRTSGALDNSSLGSTYVAACLDHSGHIVAGERPVVAIIAADRKQATVILSYVLGFLRSIPLLAETIEDVTMETIVLSNNVQIEIHTARISSPRGRPFLAVLADEIAFWATGDACNRDIEVINAVRPGLSTVHYPPLLMASSRYARRGVLHSNYAAISGGSAPVCPASAPVRQIWRVEEERVSGSS